MLENLIFFGLLSSGSAYCTVKFNRKYEEMLPITCMGIGMVLFCFGLIGYLKLGIVTVIAIAILLYFGAVFEILKNSGQGFNRLTNAVANFFSVGFFIYCAIYLVLTIVLDGLLAKEWDDFSHWMDIVKVMSTLNDFGTNPNSYSAFKSYPPAMSLFEYMLQKIYRFFNSGEAFCEWRCIFAYQIYCIALMMPMLRKSKYRKILKNISFIVAVLLVPLVFFKFMYYSTMIDPFLAFLTSAGFLAIILWENDEKDIIYSIYVWLIIATLVITKDSGMIFAFFLVAAYIGDCWIRENNFKNKIVFSAMTFVALIVPKILWKWEIAVSKVPINFETKIDRDILWNLILGKDETYRSVVLENYFTALLEKKISLGIIGIEINYLALIILEISVLFILFYFFVKRKMLSFKQACIFGITLTILLISYVFGMSVIYVFNFTEYEALKLASYERYLGTVFLGVGLIIVLMIWQFVYSLETKKQVIFGCIFLSSILLTTPIEKFKDVFTGKNIEEAQYVREGTGYLTRKIFATCDGDDRIWMISTEGSGQENFILKYNARPNVIEWPELWDTDGNIRKTAQEWKLELLNNYDYVAIYSYNDFFKDTYYELFEDVDDISIHGLYEVNKVTGMLHPVAQDIY